MGPGGPSIAQRWVGASRCTSGIGRRTLARPAGRSLRTPARFAQVVAPAPPLRWLETHTYRESRFGDPEAGNVVETPEAQARRNIDRQLAACGWTVQDRRGTNLTAATGVAIREFPLLGGEEADYLLYAAGKAIGVVEAKPEGFTLTGVEVQTDNYGAGLPTDLPAHRRPLPFLYQSTGKETRFTNLRRYKAAVLKAAVEGRLTQRWRAEHPDVEPASDLLKRILTQRHRRWEQSELAKLRAKGKPPTDDRWKKKYREPIGPDADALPPLPNGWTWAIGQQLFTWASGDFLPKKQQQPGPVPVYGGNGPSGSHSTALVTTPTLVVGRVGALCGNVHLTDGPAWVTDNAIFASSVPTELSLRFAVTVFQIARLNDLAAGSGQPFVNQQVLNELPIPLPPPDEQDEITTEVDERLSSLGAAEEAVTAGMSSCVATSPIHLEAGLRGQAGPAGSDRRSGRRPPRPHPSRAGQSVRSSESSRRSKDAQNDPKTRFRKNVTRRPLTAS